MAEKPKEPEELPADKEPQAHPDRPLECTECRKPIAVFYTEIIGESITQTCMCSDCPVLRHKLHGTPHTERVSGQGDVGAGLACGNCGTTLEAIRMGTPLGCEVCYEVFDDILIPEMLAGNRIPVRIATSKKTTPVHIGRAPGEMQEINPSLRLLALNEALKEMLKTEDYEQAAWLRDQIKELTEKTEPTTPPSENKKDNPPETPNEKPTK